MPPVSGRQRLRVSGWGGAAGVSAGGSVASRRKRRRSGAGAGARGGGLRRLEGRLEGGFREALGCHPSAAARQRPGRSRGCLGGWLRRLATEAAKKRSGRGCARGRNWRSGRFGDAQQLPPRGGGATCRAAGRRRPGRGIKGESGVTCQQPPPGSEGATSQQLAAGWRRSHARSAAKERAPRPRQDGAGPGCHATRNPGAAGAVSRPWAQPRPQKDAGAQPPAWRRCRPERASAARPFRAAWQPGPFGYQRAASPLVRLNVAPRRRRGWRRRRRSGRGSRRGWCRRWRCGRGRRRRRGRVGCRPQSPAAVRR